MSISPSFSHLLFPFLFFVFLAPSTQAIRTLRSGVDSNAQFIQNSCTTTSYPDLCVASLSSYAPQIQANPKLLAQVALNVTSWATKSTSTSLAQLAKGHGVSTKEAGPMQDCLELLGDSLDEVQKSMKEITTNSNGMSLKVEINDIETWVSAALTDDNTCMDGFDGDDPTMNPSENNVKESVRIQVVEVAHLTSIALAFINMYASSS